MPISYTQSTTPKQRLLKALHGEKPDVLPAAPCYLSLFLDDFQRAYYQAQYERHMHNRSRMRIDHAQDTHMRAEAIYQSYGILKNPPDWIEVYPGPTYAWAENTDLVNENGGLYFEDRITGKRLPLSQASMVGNPGDGVGSSRSDIWDRREYIRSRDDIDNLVPIQTAEELLVSGAWQLPRQVVIDYGEKFFISTNLDPPFSDTYSLLGFQGMMLMQYDQHALFHYLLQRKLEQSQPVLAAWAASGIHGIYAEEVFTGADILSPDSYDRYVFAYNAPYFRSLRATGLLAIHYVCGDVIPRLERILQLEIDAVAVEESKKKFKIEIEEVVQRVAGRCAVFGNIDAVRFGLNASLESMKAEVQRQAQIGLQAKGFIVSTGSPFPLDTNPRLIDTLVEAAHSIKLD